MRVIAFAPYPESAPSTRFRLSQFRQPLAALGIELVVRPFFLEEEYARVSRVGGTFRKSGLLALGLRRRAGELAEAFEADLVVIHRSLAPVLEGGLLRDLRSRKIPLVFDFDDAIFLPPQGGNPLLARLRDPRSATAALCRAADLVLAGNEYLASFAREARGDGLGVEVLPTVVDTDRYTPAERPAREGALPTVGWIGTHTTVPYLEAIYPQLEAAHREAPFRLLVVSNRPPSSHPKLEVVFRPWSEEGELALLRAMDVGIYPLPDDPWTRGKCGFKAIQYMACSVPVLASPVGVLREIVLDGKTGFHARAPEDWVRRLGSLVRDAGLRSPLGEAGRERVVEAFSVRSVGERLARSLRATAEGRP